MTFTLSRSTRNSGREPSGVFRMRLRPHSKNWTPSRNSGRRPNWENSWRLGSHNLSSLSGGVGRPPLLTARIAQRFEAASQTDVPEVRLNEAADAADAF